MTHLMTPTATALLLILAFTFDYMSIGPNSLRDRIAFLLAVPAIREGFNGSPIDQWTVTVLSNCIDAVKHTLNGAYIAGAVTAYILSALVFFVAVYAVGALAPNKWAKPLGRLAGLKFPTSGIYRINWKLWACAAVLGLMSDLLRGWAGYLVIGGVDFLASITAGLPMLIFGVS
jgi:hypothetical protein